MVVSGVRMETTTIAAIATPLGPGGIGILRISGPDALAILRRLFSRRGPSSPTPDGAEASLSFQSHRVYYGHIHHPHSGAIIDEVLVIFMQGPKSFTREDVVEIHAHSGYVVLDRLLNAVVDTGACLAEPGEFIKRAFLNGRIDLTQAEAVIDLINAPCETALQMASRQVFGGLKEVIQQIATALYSLRAQLEAAIEFADETESDDGPETIRSTLKEAVLDKLAALIQNQKDAAIYRDGALLAIAGIPNVGKSSLLNQLVDRETAIVSDMPGTTRDIIREYCSIQGVPVVFCDTAGIHASADPVESIGIRKAREQIDCANMVLLVVEAIRQLNDFERALLNQCDPAKIIVVINKIDVGTEAETARLVATVQAFRHVRVSAKEGTGIDTLKQMIFKSLVSGRDVSGSDRVAPNLRQRKLFETAHRCIEQYLFSGDASAEIAVDALNRAIAALEAVSGARGREALYDDIFSQFCVGK